MSQRHDTSPPLGRLLTLDLTAGRAEYSAIPIDILKECLGGASLGTHLWLESARIDVEPLSPANPLVIAPGLLTGFPVLAANRTSFVAKSPLTGLLSESTVGGYLGPHIRASGWDAILLKGSSASSVYVLIDQDDEVQIISASGLWGLDTFETTQRLKEAHGGDIEVAAIGLAGENQVFYASVIAGGIDSRAAGRTGMGAVMGSKNLKAVAIRKGAPRQAADRKAVAGLMSDLNKRIAQKTRAFSQFGTAGGVITCEATGDLPIQNWRGGSFSGAADITGQTMAEKGMVIGHYTCWGCPIRCGKDVRLYVGDRAGEKSHGPEYETIAGYGSLCLVDDPRYVAAANDLANRLGLDTISSANAIAFAMEAYERGIIGEDQCGGPILWGDGEAVLRLLGEIAAKRGLGGLLAKGVRSAGVALGPLAQEFAVHAKGLEIAFHDPRAFTSMAANYATALRGGCHLESLSYYVEGGAYPKDLLGMDHDLAPASADNKAELTVKMQDFMTVFNSLGVCKFLARTHVTLEEFAKWVNAALGWDISQDDLLFAAKRAFQLRRLCNIALGVTRKDDTLPPRLLSQPRPSGRAAGILPFLGKMLDEYYELRGWDAEGLPTLDTLLEFCLLAYLDKLGLRKDVLSNRATGPV